MELSKTYSHKQVEAKWYEHWMRLGVFEPAEGKAGYYSMVIPPPNVTGSLHMGHALNNTLQDILCRYKRMDGLSVLWVPGTDHAGIATQNVVERRLAARGLTRQQLGREKFIEEVWSWKREAGSVILQQLKALGVSCDWKHERFTMDEGLSNAVREAFVRLWEDDLLYRAERLVNWCPRCKTALADIEVVHEETAGSLWYIRYPFADDPGEWLVVATTRPETMLGDTAVAAHPDDERYRRFAGRNVRLPITGRVVPLLFDAYVDPAFGTGVLKITPGHDFNDFEIGARFHLDRISIFDADARIDGAAFTARGESGDWISRYHGRDRFEARRQIVEELRQQGLLEKVEEYRLAVGRCYRCQTVVEPYSTPQWFVRVKPLAEPAIRAVRDGRVRIFPEGWSHSYFAWMENIKDWCISRQIWWGHQIPAWYCRTCDAENILDDGRSGTMLGKSARPIVARLAPSACPRCGGSELIQDPDVLDTWFSSALWPFSTLGWPQDTEDFRRYYPTSALVTGFDILFFWVARMIMMALKFTGEVPFREVYIHALVRDELGQKMSKSKGNVIDPLEVMERYGTDAFRFTLAAMAAMGRDIKLAEERIAGYQNFVNKLWNAARFVLMNVGAEGPDVAREEDLGAAERWIRSRLAATIRAAREALDSYRFNDYANALYQFTWHEFCDWYIEMSKVPLGGDREAASRASRAILVEVLEQILLLLHPVMPFVTEEIWQSLRRRRGLSDHRETIMVQPYPRVIPERIDQEIEREMEFVTGAIRAIRNLRTETNCPPGREVRVSFAGPADELRLLRRYEPYLRALARAVWAPAEPGAELKNAAAAVVGSTQIFVPLGDLVNIAEEKARLMREIRKLEAELDRVRKKLANREFLAKARPDVVESERDKAGRYGEKLRALNRSLERLGAAAEERS
ncbi:MAG TPA: valine--tRNA ligase [candidate division Zixibacteria bacterium]|nr:valine--tRNA ligase [candidate division Zixibacteria bacterium]